MTASKGSGIGSAVKGLNWRTLEDELNVRGYAVTERLLPDVACRDLIEAYDNEDGYRKRVVMQRHAYGQGEYRYFGYPLPAVVADLRNMAYPYLADIANRWNAALRLDERYPETLESFLDACHRAGQVKPTPLILRYGEGDYNRLHQDLYGEHAFPLQMIFLLSEPGVDFEGGELVLTEQRPRMQSRAEVVPLSIGQAAIIAVNDRPSRGPRGYHRVKTRHGVSRIRAGHRHTLGIIFHDAA